jgi:site-specific DNA-methyltransferase (adenine-specific)
VIERATPYQLMPSLSPWEFAALKEDIRAHGVLVPVELDEAGNVLDGHHRIRAWEELRAEGAGPAPYPRHIRAGLREAEKAQLVVALNLYRRHLGHAERVDMIEALKEEGWSNRMIAAAAGVGETTVRRALAAGAPNGAPAVRVVGRDGKSYPARKLPTTVVLARSGGEEKRALEALSRLPGVARPEGLISTGDVTKAARPYRPERERPEEPSPCDIPARIEVADAMRLPLGDQSVDLIVTSPPYALAVGYAGGDVRPLRWPSFMAGWLGEAWRVAREGCRLALNVPLDTTQGGSRPTYAQAVWAAQEAGWQYRATIVWAEGNISKSIARGSVDSPAAPHVIAPVEMIGLFCRGEWKRESERPPDLAHDEWLHWTNGLWTFAGEGRAWEGHPAPFPEELPRRVIKLLSFPDDLVLDPFCGSGTTVVVAHQLGRRAIGFDSSDEYVASARRRLAAVAV